MAISNDWTNKSLKIQQIDREQKAYRAGMQNVLMMISKAHPPGELPPYVPPDKPSSPWEPGKSPAPSRKMMAHGEYFDDYGRIKKKPKGMTPSGKPFDMPVDKEQQKKNKERHDRLYHPDLMISQSPAALDALRKGLTPGLSSKQIRSLIKPYTKQDQFGHPTGSLRGV